MTTASTDASPLATGAPARDGGAAARRRRIDPHVWDGLLAILFTVAGVVYLWFGDFPGMHSVDIWAVLLLLGLTLPLFLLRTFPRAVFALIGVLSIVGAVWAYPTANVGYVAALVALFAATSRSDVWRSLALGMSASIVLIVVFIFLFRHDIGTWTAAVASWFGFCIAWVGGVAYHAYRENVDEARERAHQERERAELYLHDLEMHAMEAVTLERARLARELHDVVGHTLNIVVVQAGAAQRLFDKKPDTAREALVTIESSSRQALVDIERMLGILRAEEGEVEELGSQPGLASLERLIEQVREAGLPVELEVRGERRELPPSVDLSAYRIVQEALTNTLKHAGAGARAFVSVTYHDDDLCIEALDDGGGLPTPAGSPAGGGVYVGGRGLVGMRERVLLFGGRLEVGPRPEGGFRVFACLPIAGLFGRRAGGAAGAAAPAAPPAPPAPHASAPTGGDDA